MHTTGNLPLVGRAFTVLAFVAFVCPPAVLAASQDCKPDISQVDKISRMRVDAYSQPLFATSFMSSMWKAQETYITMLLVRTGDRFGIQLVVEKKEGSEERAIFESQYRAALGSPIQFGFKNGAPIAIMVTDVRNNSQMTGFLPDSKRLTTTVTLAADFKEEDLPTIGEAFRNRQVDAVRVRLAGGVEITKTVDDKLGRQLVQKAACFFVDVEKTTAALPADALATLAAGAGRYNARTKSGDYLDLGRDGTFGVHQDGKDYKGKVVSVRADVLTFRVLNVMATADARLDGNTLVWMVPPNDVWDRTPEVPAAPAGSPGAATPKASTSVGAKLTIDQIVQMVAAKLPDDIIITTIRSSGSTFDLSPEALIRMKTSGVSDAVIRAMTQ